MFTVDEHYIRLIVRTCDPVNEHKPRVSNHYERKNALEVIFVEDIVTARRSLNPEHSTDHHVNKNRPAIMWSGIHGVTSGCLAAFYHGRWRSWWHTEAYCQRYLLSFFLGSDQLRASLPLSPPFFFSSLFIVCLLCILWCPLVYFEVRRAPWPLISLSRLAVVGLHPCDASGWAGRWARCYCPTVRDITSPCQMQAPMPVALPVLRHVTCPWRRLLVLRRTQSVLHFGPMLYDVLLDRTSALWLWIEIHSFTTSTRKYVRLTKIGFIHLR